MRLQCEKAISTLSLLAMKDRWPQGVNVAEQMNMEPPRIYPTSLSISCHKCDLNCITPKRDTVDVHCGILAFPFPPQFIYRSSFWRPLIEHIFRHSQTPQVYPLSGVWLRSPVKWGQASIFDKSRTDTPEYPSSQADAFWTQIPSPSNQGFQARTIAYTVPPSPSDCDLPTPSSRQYHWPRIHTSVIASLIRTAGECLWGHSIQILWASSPWLDTKPNQWTQEISS